MGVSDIHWGTVDKTALNDDCGHLLPDAGAQRVSNLTSRLPGKTFCEKGVEVYLGPRRYYVIPLRYGPMPFSVWVTKDTAGQSRTRRLGE